MGKRSQQFKSEKLVTFLVYLLGHRPDEFGLVPDLDGFVSYKELLQALHEEPGWTYMRRSHLNEMLMGKDRSLFESSGRGLRVIERRWPFELESKPGLIPGILFTPVRRRAHPVVMEDGLQTTLEKPVVLCHDKEMALRIGTRKDQDPVVLEVMARKAASQGVAFHSFGRLFLSTHLPAKFIAGPKVAKEVLERKQPSVEEKSNQRYGTFEFAPGSLILDITMEPKAGKRVKGKKKKGWKEEARKIRKKGTRKGEPGS